MKCSAAENESEYGDPKASQLNLNAYEDIAGSEDDFHIGRDKVWLDDEPTSKRRKETQLKAGKYLSLEKLLVGRGRD